MKNILPILFLLCSATLFSQSISLSEFSSGFNWLLGATHAGDDRLFAIQKFGQIYIIDKDGNRNPTPFLDIATKVRSGQNDERGLLGVAFDPNYEANGYFYIYYTKSINGAITISRFERSASDPNVADPNSEVELLSFPHARFNHVGGALAFGPDGYLYIGVGDGGGSGDPDNAGQDLNALHGKILRIDVSNGTASIPADNPFINTSGAKPEIWAYGLRNPWRINFDRWTGDLWIADVGQNELEEINLQLASSPGGKNYGWSCKEGTDIFRASECIPGTLLVDPVYEYSHRSGSCGGSISGGVAYRGMEYGDLFGKYFAADFCTGDIYMVDKAGNGKSIARFGSYQFSALAENHLGEMFLTGYFSNEILKIESDNPAPTAFITNGVDVSICEGDSIRLGAYNIPEANMSFEWLFNGTPINGANGPAVTVSQDGDYQVIVTNEGNGMKSTSVATTLKQTSVLRETITESVDVGTLFQGVLITGDTSFTQTFQSSFGCDSIVTYNINGFTNALEVEDLFQRFDVTPNPFDGFLSIQLELSSPVEMKMDLYDFNGILIENIVENQRFLSGRYNFDKELNDVSSGFYYLVSTTNKGILTKKLMKI